MASNNFKPVIAVAVSGSHRVGLRGGDQPFGDGAGDDRAGQRCILASDTSPSESHVRSRDLPSLGISLLMI
jgi:hypothetical protein